MNDYIGLPVMALNSINLKDIDPKFVYHCEPLSLQNLNLVSIIIYTSKFKIVVFL
jgi:hypothetical protein